MKRYLGLLNRDLRTAIIAQAWRKRWLVVEFPTCDSDEVKNPFSLSHRFPIKLDDRQESGAFTFCPGSGAEFESPGPGVRVPPP